MSDAMESSGKSGVAKNPVAMLLIGLSSGLLIAYGVGIWQRNKAMSAQEATYTAQLAGKDAELAAAAAKFQEAQALLAAERSRAELTAARGAVYRALNDLDARNFGIANDRLREAAQKLEGVDASALGFDPAQLSAIGADLRRLDLLVATDLQAQRIALLELAARLEGLGNGG